MNYNFFTSSRFEKEVKRLSKKFPSLKSDLLKLQKDIIYSAKFGTPLGKNLYKIRLKVKSKSKGKSGGFRVINYIELSLIEDLSDIYLLTIYDKSETGNISVSEIQSILRTI